jgi:hypothetical protein
MADKSDQDDGGASDEQSSDLGLHDAPNTDSGSGQSSASDWDKSPSTPSGARATRARGKPKNVSDEDPKP